ncbi:YxiJ family protein [Microbacteriaceae bacterium 4G12]
MADGEMGDELIMRINQDLLIELKRMSVKLRNAFPSEDIEKIEEYFPNIDNEECYLTGDFDQYCSLISGSLDYVLSNKRIPKYQRKKLHKDFFALYPHYVFLKENINQYPNFYHELEVHEQTRQLLLEVIKL